MTGMGDKLRGDRDRMSAEEARAAYEKLIAEADRRGGTPRGEILVNIVNGRRLS